MPCSPTCSAFIVWFDFTVTVSLEFMIGAGVEIDAVQVACGPGPVVTVLAVFVLAATARVVVAVAALVVTTATVVTAFLDDPGTVAGVDGRVVAIVGDVFDGLAGSHHSRSGRWSIRPQLRPASDCTRPTSPANGIQ